MKFNNSKEVVIKFEEYNRLEGKRAAPYSGIIKKVFVGVSETLTNEIFIAGAKGTYPVPSLTSSDLTMIEFYVLLEDDAIVNINQLQI